MKMIPEEVKVGQWLRITDDKGPFANRAGRVTNILVDEVFGFVWFEVKLWNEEPTLFPGDRVALVVPSFSFAQIDSREEMIISLDGGFGVGGMEPTLHDYKIIQEATKEYLLGILELQNKIREKYEHQLDSRGIPMTEDEEEETWDDENPYPDETNKLWYG